MANARAKKKKKGNTPVKQNKIQLFPPKKIVEIAFYSFIMFALGVLVGRSSVPVLFKVNENKAGLESLALSETENAPVKVKINFHKVLSSDEDTPIDAKLIEQDDKIPEKSPSYKGSKKHGDLYEIETSVPVADDNETKKTETVDTKVLELKDFAYTIQVAALKSQADADVLSEKLKKAGFLAYSISVNTDDGSVWFRVRVGKFQAQSEAEKIKKDLIEKLNINGLILKVN